MGSNMQRQAVPLLIAEPPIVATGLEKAVAMNSGMIVKAPQDATVTYVDSSRIVLDNNITFKLRKYVGLNERTCLNQKPVVDVGQKVKKGDLLADGAAPSTASWPWAATSWSASWPGTATTSKTRSSSAKSW